MTAPWLLLADNGANRLERATAPSPRSRTGRENRGRRQPFEQIIGVAAALGNWVGSGQNVSDNGGSYNQIHIEEAIDSKNNDHRELSVITGRLEQPVNRR